VDYPDLYIGDLLAAAASAASSDVSAIFETGVCVKVCPKNMGGSETIAV